MKLSLKQISFTKQMAMAGALIGAVAFLLVYGAGVINPANLAVVRGGYLEADITQHYTGWLFFRQSPWQFPLGIAQNMNYPSGGYVGFTDSIPIFAVLFKLLSPVLPASFQYFGLWAFLCSVLMGVSGALLLSLFTNSRLRCLILTPVFVFAPIFLERQLRHTALGAQWLIVFAIYLYFKARRSGRYFSVGFLVLAALSIAIHPYFVPMVFAVLFALLVEIAVQTRKIAKPAIYLLMCFASTLLTGFVLGAFATGFEGGSTLYGYFSMNLNALFNPSSLGYGWSILLPKMNQVLGNYDGFNYLGLGLIIALVCIGADILLHIKKVPVREFLKQRFGILFVSVCLTVFAVSSTVTAMGRVLFKIPLPQFVLELAGNFRSSGRMFYPVWYLLALLVCVWILRRPKESWKTIAAVVLVGVQLIDISPVLLQKNKEMHPYTPWRVREVREGFWEEMQGEYKHMYSLDFGGLIDSITTAQFAAENNMTTNDPFLARYGYEVRTMQVQQGIADLKEGNYDANTIYITSDVMIYEELMPVLKDELYCGKINEKWFVFCPYTETFNGYAGADARPAGEHPLLVNDFTDDLWENGMLKDTPNIICFLDTAFTRSRIEGMRALSANGEEFQILDISYKDAGWIMLTLDTQSAAALRGVALESIP